MCKECRQIICPSSCPNADEPKKIFTCKYCNEPITEGEEFAMFEEKYFHLECFLDAAPAILVEKGAITGIAENN